MSSANSETRIRILKSAWKLLEAETASEVRMSDIAKAAGISRQAVYLHFPNRADLLIAATRYIDEVKNVDARLAASRAAPSGVERLDAFVEAWGNYIPQIHGVAKALISMQDKDREARLAWNDRLQAIRDGCEAAVGALERDGQLSRELSPVHATDLLWTLLSVENWQHLTRDCGWSRQAYVDAMKSLARRAIVATDG
jgi:AcrR family transcriptional regulator